MPPTMTRTWFVPALLLLAAASIACGSRRVGATDTSTPGQKTPARLEQTVVVAWVLEDGPPQASAPSTRVALSLTDETGATSIEAVGELPGRCQEIQAGSGLLAAECDAGPIRTHLRVRRYGGELIIVRASVEQQGVLDESAFEELVRIAVPAGATIRASE